MRCPWILRGEERPAENPGPPEGGSGQSATPRIGCRARRRSPGSGGPPATRRGETGSSRSGLGRRDGYVRPWQGGVRIGDATRRRTEGRSGHGARQVFGDDDRRPLAHCRLVGFGETPTGRLFRQGASDGSSRQTERRRGADHHCAPSPTRPDNVKPLVGTIHGVVRFGPTFRPDRITVRINGSTIEPTTTSNGGRFRFENVPAGKYAIEARGPSRAISSREQRRSN